jgi:hypothetical protein
MLWALANLPLYLVARSPTFKDISRSINSDEFDRLLTTQLMGETDMMRRVTRIVSNDIIHHAHRKEAGNERIRGRTRALLSSITRKKGIHKGHSLAGKRAGSHKEADIMKQRCILSVDAKNRRGGWRTEKK